MAWIDDLHESHAQGSSGSGAVAKPRLKNNVGRVSFK